MKGVTCVILHGTADDSRDKSYNKQWMPWIKTQLITKGVKTIAPNMPNPWKPDYEVYKKEFDKIEVNENTILIGHSSGCAFLVRWLGETKKKVKKLILVAPWKIPYGKIKKEFYDYEIDKTISKRVKDIVIFTSDNEEADGKKSAKIFHNALGGKMIELKGRGHYTLEDMESEEFPELLEVLLD